MLLFEACELRGNLESLLINQELDSVKSAAKKEKKIVKPSICLPHRTRSGKKFILVSVAVSYSIPPERSYRL